MSQNNLDKEQGGVIQKIQRQSGCLILVIGGAMLAFILSDMLGGGGGGGQRVESSVGTVNGQEISQTEFDERYKTFLTNYQQSNPDVPITDALRKQYKDQTWNSFVQERTYKPEFEALGIATNAEDVRYHIFDQPHPFVARYFTDPATGQVNTSVLSRFLKQDMQNNPEAKSQYLQIENGLSATLEQQKYDALVKNCLYVTKAEAKRNVELQTTSKTIKLVGKEYVALKDSLFKPTERQLKSYYNDNKHQFKQAESRSFKYSVIPVIPSRADTQFAYAEIERIKKEFAETENDSLFLNYNSNKRFDGSYKGRGSFDDVIEDQLFAGDTGTVFGPIVKDGQLTVYKILDKKKDSVPSVRVSHIIVRATGGVETPRQKAEKILADLKSGRTSFEEEARNNFDQTSLKGGDMGWVKKDQMSFNINPEIEEKAFTVPRGGYFIVESRGNAEIVKVTSSPTYDIIQVGEVSSTIQALDETEKEAFALAREVLIDINAKGEFNEAVEAKNLRVGLAENIIPARPEVAGFNNTSELIQWLYDDNRKVNDLSNVMRIDNNYVIAQCTDITEKGIKIFENAKEQVTVEVIKKLKAEQLIEEMNKALEGSNTIDDVASKMKVNIRYAPNVNLNNSNIPNVGKDAKVLGVISALEKGVLSQPIDGNNGVFIAVVEEVNTPEELPQLAPIQMQLSQEKKQEMDADLPENLKEILGVENELYKYY